MANIKTIEVEAVAKFTFYADVSDIMPDCVDIDGLAIELAMDELGAQMVDGVFDEYDFEYKIVRRE